MTKVVKDVTTVLPFVKSRFGAMAISFLKAP